MAPSVGYDATFQVAPYNPMGIGETLFIPVLFMAVAVFGLTRPELLVWGNVDDESIRRVRVISAFMLVFSAAFVPLTQLAWYHQSTKLGTALVNGSVRTLEGCLDGFHRMPSEGHDTDRIQVNGTVFSYSDFEGTPGFHQTEVYGGPVHADSRVKVWYLGNDIANRLKHRAVRQEKPRPD